MIAIKKWKLAVVALLLVVIAGTVGLTASAATLDDAIAEDDIDVDYVNETITVTTADDNIVYFTTTYNKDVSRWDACEVREFEESDGQGGTVKVRKAIFDISWIANNKTVRLYICGDVNTKVVNADIVWEESFGVKYVGTLLNTDITEAETWKEIYYGDLKDPTDGYPYFSEDTGYFIFTIADEGRDKSYFELENIQWRKGNDGVWRDYDELDLKEMNIRGINLEFRVAANDTDGAKAKASSVAKVAVTKLASAPISTVNPDMMTVGVKNGLEFSFDKENWIMVPLYNSKFGTEDYLVNESERESAIETIYTKERRSTLMIHEMMQEHLKVMEDLKTTTITPFYSNSPMDRTSLEQTYNDYFTFTDDGIKLYVRTISSERKAASKIAEIVIPYSFKDANEDRATAKAGDVEFSYGDSKTNTGGIVVNNKSQHKYQVGVITPSDKLYDTVNGYFTNGNLTTPVEEHDLDLSGVKWTAVKEGKMTKLSNNKVPEKSYLIYRIAGEDGYLPSTYLISNPMKYNHVTYAGIANATMTAGKTLTAVPSTNFKLDATDGKYKDAYGDTLSFQWQSSEDKQAEDAVWEDPAAILSTDPTLELTNDMDKLYIRVVITDLHGNKKVSTPVGPVKAVQTPATPNP